MNFIFVPKIKNISTMDNSLAVLFTLNISEEKTFKRMVWLRVQTVWLVSFILVCRNPPTQKLIHWED